jgi:D-alanyl-D-alanine carboxypeptidase
MTRLTRALAAILLAWAALAAAEPAPPPIAAKAYIVVDLLSGQTLAAANERRSRRAASPPLMTAYLVRALRTGKLDGRRNHGSAAARRRIAHLLRPGSPRCPTSGG